MDIRIISGAEVRELLPMRRCIDVMRSALAALAQGDAVVPLRHVMWLPDRSGLLGMMPAHSGPAAVMGIKVVSVMPGNHGTPWDAHQGGVLLFDTTHGRPLALVDATAITAIRTAAVSGLATEQLARADAKKLAMLGSGVQAESHVEAMLAVRALELVRVWSRTAARADAFAARARKRYGIAVDAVHDAREAVTDADVICTVTASREPVLRGAWLEPGMHINAVGSSVSTARELDAEAVARCRLFVDRRESTLHEAGDFLLARAEGAVSDTHIEAELGEVVTGVARGRGSDADTTLFKSLGLGIEDVAAAHEVYLRAAERGVGVSAPLGGARA